MSDGTRYAFEPFGSLDGVLRGDPIKIMPLGTFYRDSRKLEITPARLQAFANNVKAGLPRFRIPINENHAGVGKIGTVSDVAFMEAGPDGPGLYATVYEFTDQGRQLITDKRFDAVSPETIWTLNDGATYQDPQTGTKHDNVLVGLALTDRPFFGHDNVALFSDTPAAAKRHNGYTKLVAKMKAQFDEWVSQLSGADGNEPADPPAIENAAASPAANTEGALTMPDTVVTPPPAAEQFAVSREAFEALQAKAAKADALEAQVTGLTSQAEQFAIQLKATNRARRLEQLVLRAERFTAIPVEPGTLAEKFQAIEDASPDLFKWLEGLLETLDTQIKQGALFSQAGSTRRGAGAETFEDVIQAVLKEKFNGDQAHYGEAFREAGQRRKDLAAAYIAGQR